MSQPVRCSWCGTDPLYVAYHDNEWGIPVSDDRTLFEFLTLEGAQAGLSWITILRKRENYRKHFCDWDIDRIVNMSDVQLETILLDPGIVRNRLKIYSVRKNAVAVLRIISEFGSLRTYFESFFLSIPLVHSPRTLAEIPAHSDESDRISKDLKKRGCSFIGSTIIYAFLQATGFVDDHTIDCFRKTRI